MISKYRTTTLGELIQQEGGSIKTGPFGTTLKASEYSESGVPVISVGEVGFGEIRLHQRTPRVDRDVTERLSEYVLEAGDIVFGRKGAVERSAWVKDDQDGWFLGSDGIRLRLHNTTNSRFISYYLLTERHRSWMLTNCVGTTMHSLNQGVIERVPIVLPPLPIQNRIADILSAFDNKIELNRQMNRTLEQMARALFKSWFIDFDPVHAKQRGEQPAGMDAETAALFPDRFVEIDGREVPEGWAYGSVSDIAQQAKNQMNPSDHPDALFSHFSIPAFDASGRPALERGSEIKSNKFVVPEEAILVSKLNPVTPRIWDTDLSESTNYRVSSTEFIPLVALNGDLRAFLYLALTSPDFAKALSGQASGTSNSHQRVKPSDILCAPVVLPPAEVVAAFGSLVFPILDHVKRNLRETNHLAHLRDSLLPRLLSGELDVRDWETVLNEPEATFA